MKVSIKSAQQLTRLWIRDAVSPQKDKIILFQNHSDENIKMEMYSIGIIIQKILKAFKLAHMKHAYSM